MVEAIKTRAAAHSFEGKVFSIVSCSTISEEIVEAVAGDDPALEPYCQRENSAFSGIFGPDGRLLTEPLIDDEGIVYAEIDLSKCIQPKQMHDIVGHYNRFDIFDLRVNTRAHRSVTLSDNDFPRTSLAGTDYPYIKNQEPQQQPAAVVLTKEEES